MVRRAVLALGATLALVPAAPAGAVGLERFDGQSRGGHAVVLRLTEARAAYDVRVGGRCSDGSSFASGLRGDNAEIDDAGRFIVDDAKVRDRYAGRPGLFRFTLDAQRFGTVVRGRVRVRFAGGGLSCDSGFTPFAAHLDGSRRAPLRDTRSTTGLYTARGKGLRDVRAVVFLPARRVTRISFAWKIGCRRKVQLTGRETFVDLRIGQGRFGLAGRSTVSLGAGRTSRETWSLRGRLFRARGVYQVEGTWTVRAVVARGGKELTRCATPGLGFSGRFRHR